jgi:hypothetical protein
MDISMGEMEEQEAEQAAEASATAAAGGNLPESSTSAPQPATSATPFTAPPPPSVAVHEPGTQDAADAAAAKEAAHAASFNIPTPTASGTSTPRSARQVPVRAAIMDRSEEEARMEAAGVTDAEKELRAKEKRKGLTKEQREELAAYELERKKIREERVANLLSKLIDRISIWTETDKGADVTKAFKDKTQLEIENLKMESFGLEIMHAIGATYLQKAGSFLKSQKFLGISGFFSRLKDKGTLAKETWTTISTAIDAQMTMEEMAKMEEKGGEDWTDEKKAEYEKRVTGKILAAAWRGSKFEIQSVLREVCDKVLNDKKVKLEKRIERAEALMIVGEMMSKVSFSLRLFFLSIGIMANSSNRLHETQTMKAATWPSSSSWPSPPRRKSTSTTRRRKRRTRRRRSPPHLRLRSRPECRILIN